MLPGDVAAALAGSLIPHVHIELPPALHNTPATHSVCTLCLHWVLVADIANHLLILRASYCIAAGGPLVFYFLQLPSAPHLLPGSSTSS